MLEIGPWKPIHVTNGMVAKPNYVSRGFVHRMGRQGSVQIRQRFLLQVGGIDNFKVAVGDEHLGALEIVDGNAVAQFLRPNCRRTPHPLYLRRQLEVVNDNGEGNSQTPRK